MQSAAEGCRSGCILVCTAVGELSVLRADGYEPYLFRRLIEFGSGFFINMTFFWKGMPYISILYNTSSGRGESLQACSWVASLLSNNAFDHGRCYPELAAARHSGDRLALGEPLNHHPSLGHPRTVSSGCFLSQVLRSIAGQNKDEL